MLDQQINEQLGLLQNELSKLKSLTDYLEKVKYSSSSIIEELDKVQQNYTVYTDKIFSLYKQYLNDLKQNTEIQINDGVLRFETTGNKIDATNKEKLIEIKRLLEQHKKIAESTDNLVKTLESVDFPARLSCIDSNINSVNNALVDNHYQIIQRIGVQDATLKSLKNILFVACGLILVGTVSIIIIFKQL